MAHNLDTVPGAPSVDGNNSKSSIAPAPPRLGSNDHNLVFGATYDSTVIVPDGTAPVELANPVSVYVPSARPGSRAPHVWLERMGERISTLDLFGREFVLLAGIHGQSWCNAAKLVSDSQGVPVQHYRVGTEGDLTDPDDDWAMTYGVKDDGAVLVRPDGYVAWRCATLKADPILEIDMALRTALARQPIRQRQAA